MAEVTMTQKLKSKEYETIYVLRGDVDADTAEKVQQRVSEVISRESGKMTKVEAWGRRKLAYPVAKQKKGVYVFVKYVGQGGLVAELERNLKLQDSVLKFQTVQTHHDVDVSALTIDPEEVKMARLELPVEEEEKESRERSLGLLDTGEQSPRSRSYDRDEEFGGDRGKGKEEGKEEAKEGKEEGKEEAKEEGKEEAKEEGKEKEAPASEAVEEKAADSTEGKGE